MVGANECVCVTKEKKKILYRNLWKTFVSCNVFLFVASGSHNSWFK